MFKEKTGKPLNGNVRLCPPMFRGQSGTFFDYGYDGCAEQVMVYFKKNLRLFSCGNCADE
jgi:hypothetical protein